MGVATAHKQRVKGAVGVASAEVGGVGVATARAGERVWPLRMRRAGRREEGEKASLAGAI